MPEGEYSEEVLTYYFYIVFILHILLAMASSVYFYYQYMVNKFLTHLRNHLKLRNET